MSREDLMRKVRRLLAIGRRSNYQAEAENALAIAQRLMLEHGLSELEVDAADRQYADTVVGPAFARRPEEDIYVGRILEAFFFVRCGWVTRYEKEQDRCRITRQVFGEEHHRAIGEFVWVYLVRTFRAFWNARRNTLGRRAGRRSLFYQGLQEGLSRRLHDERWAHQRQHPQQAGLITLKRQALTSAFDLFHPSAKPVGRHRVADDFDEADLLAWDEGRRRGQAISIPTALASREKSPRLLEAAQ